jgi:hypothetical protein
LPCVVLSTKLQDPAVFGVLGDPDRKILSTYTQNNNSFKKTLIVHSIGTGMICVCDKGGNILIGDYIQSSGYEGYGMKQPNTTLNNYTVAKATMNVDFSSYEIKLNAQNNPLYTDFFSGGDSNTYRFTNKTENGYRVSLCSCIFVCG